MKYQQNLNMISIFKFLIWKYITKLCLIYYLKTGNSLEKGPI